MPEIIKSGVIFSVLSAKYTQSAGVPSSSL